MLRVFVLVSAQVLRFSKSISVSVETEKSVHSQKWMRKGLLKHSECLLWNGAHYGGVPSRDNRRRRLSRCCFLPAMQRPPPPAPTHIYTHGTTTTTWKRSRASVSFFAPKRWRRRLRPRPARRQQTGIHFGRFCRNSSQERCSLRKWYQWKLSAGAGLNQSTFSARYLSYLLVIMG